MNVPTFRYDFSKEFLNHLIDFYTMYPISDKDSRQEKLAFKINWDNWKSQNDDLILQEHNRLLLLGFSSDMDHKMYQCIRSYIPKKQKQQKLQKNIESEKVVNKHLNKGFAKDFLKNIDEFIVQNLHLGKKPVDLFQLYYSELQSPDQPLVSDRLKKTFQNRYQNIKTNMKTNMKTPYK